MRRTTPAVVLLSKLAACASGPSIMDVAEAHCTPATISGMGVDKATCA